jgi:crossover junction endodeoxyribonuclease RuvC
MTEQQSTIVTVGLDMSLTSSGFSLFNGKEIVFETIKTKPANFNNDLDRLQHITNTVLSKIPHYATLICIEDYFVPQSKMQFGAALSLCALGTLMRMKLYESGLPFIVVSPNQLKKFATGKGNAQKSLVIREVYKKYNIDVKDDNQADAIVLAKIAEACLKFKGGNRVGTEFERETIDKIIADRPKYNIK